MRYREDNTEGYTTAQLTELNRRWEAIRGDEIEDRDERDAASERMLTEYDTEHATPGTRWIVQRGDGRTRPYEYLSKYGTWGHNLSAERFTRRRDAEEAAAALEDHTVVVLEEPHSFATG